MLNNGSVVGFLFGAISYVDLFLVNSIKIEKKTRNTHHCGKMFTMEIHSVLVLCLLHLSTHHSAQLKLIPSRKQEFECFAMSTHIMKLVSASEYWVVRVLPHVKKFKFTRKYFPLLEMNVKSGIQSHTQTPIAMLFDS